MKTFLLTLAIIFTFSGCFFSSNNLSHQKNLSVYESEKSYKNINISSAFLNQFKEWEGVTYKYGGESKSGVDCSYFVMNSFQKISYKLPRTTLYQSKSGKAVKKNELQLGDLVFFITSKKGTRHVGIYLGDGDFMHASTSNGVMISSLENPYWKAHYWKARRVLN